MGQRPVASACTSGRRGLLADQSRSLAHTTVLWLHFCLVLVVIVDLPVAVAQNCTASPDDLPALLCDERCQEETLTALNGIYQGLGGPIWAVESPWFRNTSCGDGVPHYCCWSGIQCCCHGCGTLCYNCPYQYAVQRMVLVMVGATGDLNNVMDELEVLSAYGLQVLDLSNNALSGTLPARLNGLTNLTSLELRGNGFRGQVPTLNNLTRLELLNLEYNRLEGRLGPETLCQKNNTSALARLYLRGNRNLEGHIRLSYCRKLVLIDLQDNNFTGPVPFMWLNQLHTLKLANNNLTDIPSGFYNLSGLTFVSLGNNRISGTIAKEIGKLSYVTHLDLSFNDLDGTLPPELFTLQQLTDLYLTANPKLEGSIPAAIQRAVSLERLMLQGTGISGTIPPELGRLNALSHVDLRTTLLNCCTAATINVTSPSANLPSFLTFEPDALVQPLKWNNSNLGKVAPSMNMSCPYVKPAVEGQRMDSWKIDPSYYWFQGCVCRPGYTNVSTTYSQMVCHMPHTSNRSTLAKDISIAVLAALLLSILLAALLFRYLIQNRHAILWMRNMAAVEKRLKGMPRSGRMSVVVTDIEGYSTMMKETPDLMQSALNQHNSILRRCKRDNSGYTAEQEGDSFTMLFYDPVDAVMFCLQAQQALLKASWPEGLVRISAEELLGSEREGSKMRSRRSTREALQGLGRRLEVAYNTLTSGGRDSGGRLRWKGQLELVSPDHALMAAEEGEAQHIDDVVAARSGPPVRHGSLPHRWESLGSGQGSKCNEHVKSDEEVDQVAGGTGGTPVMMESQGSHSSNTSLRSLVLGHSRATRYRMFNGLRVRMGIATGVVESHEEVKGSSLWDRAKVVSDMAQGGQVLMDVWTWDSVKDLGADLAAVDSNGFNVNKLAGRGQLLKRLYKQLRKSLLTRLGRVEEESWRRVSPEREVTMLDMGEYAFLADAAHSSPRVQLHALSESSPWLVPRQYTSSCPNRLNIHGAVLPSVLAESCGTLRTWQVLPPPLVGRAKTFGSTLNLKEGALKIDAPYFDAPGTAVAQLDYSESSLSSTGSGSPPLPILPHVTTVFCCVEDAKKLRRKRVHGLLSMCIRDALSMVPGGYLCREQEGELKYMLTFSCSSSALLFCLSVQSASMYVNWPAHLDLREQWDDKKGRWVFRGPRLKMGVCEGHPTSILPDHVGRADYHGECVNMAARFMDAAAHGGQVVCEKSLALEVLEKWRKANERHERSLVHGKGLLEQAPCSRIANSKFSWNQLRPAPFMTGLVGLEGRASSSTERVDILLQGAELEHRDIEQGESCWEPRDPALQRSSVSDSASCTGRQQRDDPSVTLARQSLPSGLHGPASAATTTVIGVQTRDVDAEQLAFSLAAAAYTPKREDCVGDDGNMLDNLNEPPVPCGCSCNPSNPCHSEQVRGSLQGHGCIEEVGVYSVGDFRFKGSLNTLTMVNVMLTSLSARRFPQEAPKGKGSCIRQAEGLLNTVHVVLPNLSAFYGGRLGSKGTWRAAGDHLEPILRSLSLPVENLASGVRKVTAS